MAARRQRAGTRPGARSIGRWLAIGGLVIGGLVAVAAASLLLAPAPAEAQSGELDSVSTGQHISCGLSGGELYCWGRPPTTWGQGPSMDDPDRVVPTRVDGVSGGRSVSVGVDHACVLLDDGTVSCLGHNLWGQLGDGTTVTRATPAPVPGLDGVTAISSGYQHTCALLGDGTVSCWGGNFHGQLGDGTRATRATAAPVTGLTGVVAIDAGWEHTCAITTDGQAWCWGYNVAGQLGDGTTTRQITPTEVVGLGDAAQLGAGQQHTCAVRRGGQASCWGRNARGQLGDGSTDDRTTPVDVVDLDDAVSVTADVGHTCAVVADGTARCWGRGAFLGAGDQPDRSVPVEVTGLTGVESVAAGFEHTCATTSAGAYCWGTNPFGQLGTGDTSNRNTPGRVLFGVVEAAITGTALTPDGQPVEGVGVDLFTEGRGGYLRSTTTAADGTYRLLVIEPGCHVVTFVAPEFTSFVDGSGFRSVDVCVASGETVAGIDAVLIDDRATDARAFGRVVDDKTRDPVAGVVIDLFTADEAGNRLEYLRSATTGADGEAEFRLSPAGCYALTFVAPTGLQFDPGVGRPESPWITTAFCLAPGGSFGASVRLIQEAADATVAVDVVDGAGAGVDGVAVDLFAAGADGLRAGYLRSMTTTAGSADFAVDAGCYVVVAVAPDGRLFDNGTPWSELPVCVEAGATSTVTARLT